MNVRQPVDRFKSLSQVAQLRRPLRLRAARAVRSAAAAGAGRRCGSRRRCAIERTAIAAGEWWRLLTAHFVHLDLEHALLNTLGLVLMWALFARDYRPRAVAGHPGHGPGWRSMPGLWLRDPNVDWYVGASGALHGVMAAGTLAHVRRGDLDGWILAVFMVAKLAYEQLHGALPFAESGEPVVVNAHLYGALGGAGLRPRCPEARRAHSRYNPRAAIIAALPGNLIRCRSHSCFRPGIPVGRHARQPRRHRPGRPRHLR